MERRDFPGAFPTEDIVVKTETFESELGRITLSGWRLFLFAILTTVAIGLTACGDDPCADVVCDFGVCNQNNGQCTNRNFCSVESDCIPGFQCGSENSCQAQNTCTENQDCDTGVCRDGGCVNPSTCEENGDCLARTFCSRGGTCEPDPCNDITCQRGVCERGTDNCISADSCTTETEVLDCVAGERCAEGSCEPPETFCDDITCDRGVCSFGERGCANSDDCAGDEVNCLEGYFCNEMDQCRVDLCEQNQVDCMGNGVCVPASGQCQNATACDANQDCLADHVCVQNTCRLQSVACGNASGNGGCPGNQNCDYDETNLTASCTEPDVCETAIDCLDGRQCGGQSCVTAVDCSADLWEPNNMASEATDFAVGSKLNMISGSLCSGDIDVYTFDTTDLVDQTETGEIVVDVTIPRRDIGLGEMNIRLLSPDGSELDTAALGTPGQSDSARVRTQLRIPTHGIYTVEIAEGDEMSSAGLRYEMSVNVPKVETVEACQQTQVIRVGQRVSGNAAEAASLSLGSSCTAQENPNTEIIYALQLDAPQQVVITGTPQLSTADISLSLRGRCMESSTESACVDDEGEGSAEVIDELLGAGTHYVIVQAPLEATLDNFELTVEGSFLTTCSGASNYCSDGQTANLCTSDGGRFDTFTCGAGCNPSTGSCFPPAGDRCENADVISAENGDTSITFNLRELNNDYELGADSCVGNGEARTGGPEQTYAIELPAGTAVTANVSFANEVIGSVYFAEDCADLVGTCATGIQNSGESPSQEELTYSNLSESAQTRYLVVDTAAEQNVGEVTVDLAFLPVICTPAMNQCTMAGEVETCNDFGTAYAVTDNCNPWPCGMGACQRPDTCAAPLNVTQVASQSGGVTYTDSWSTFTDALGGEADTDACFSNSFDTEDLDTVYEVNLQAGEAFRATGISSGTLADPSMTIRNACADLSDANCLSGDAVQDTTAVAEYVASANETIYVVLDSDDPPSGETFTVGFELFASSCTQGSQSCVSGNVQYCPPSNVPRTFACTGGCANGFCNTRTSEFCYDAENITTAANTSSGYTQALSLSNFANDIEYDACGGVSDFENDGPDAVYAIDLNAGEVLDATFDNRSSTDDPALILLSDCADLTGNCLAGDEDSDTASLQYLAQSSQTVYLVADVDDPTVSDTFDLTVTVSPQQCDPAVYTPACDGSGNLQYCSDLGQFVTYTCQGGCSMNACGTPQGGICADAVPLGNGQTGSQAQYVGTNNLDPVGTNRTGSCTFPEETAGADWVYEVSLQANETLTADYTGTGLGSSGSSFDVMYVLGDCTDTTTCIDAVDGDGSITYTAGNSAETVYVVLDHESYVDETLYGIEVTITITP